MSQFRQGNVPVVETLVVPSRSSYITLKIAAPFRVAVNRVYAEKIKTGASCSHPASSVKGIYCLEGWGGGRIMGNL